MSLAFCLICCLRYHIFSVTLQASIKSDNYARLSNLQYTAS